MVEPTTPDADKVGAAIGELLTGFTAGVDHETRESARYEQMLTMTRVEALRLVWDENRDRTIAVASRIAAIKELPLRDEALWLLFCIRGEVGALRNEYRSDGLGGSTDRAFQVFARAVDIAFRGDSSITEIPPTFAELAQHVSVYEHLEGNTMQLLRWLELGPDANRVLWMVAKDHWGFDSSSHAAYDLWRHFPKMVALFSAKRLEPTDEELAAFGETVFGQKM